MIFTVFTPTYNRGHLLPRVYASLQAQTMRDFEWVIVDDGSTDDTKEIVDGFIAQKPDFPIRYAWQSNGHKKTAFNHGVRLAQGELFVSIDSDDELTPNALADFRETWETIPKIRKDEFAGVCGLCQFVDGKIVGDTFPVKSDGFIDCSSFEMSYKYKVSGDKFSAIQINVLKSFPFAEYLYGLVPESTVWNAIGLKYKYRYFNKVLCIYHQDAGDQLTRTNFNDLRQWYTLVYAQSLELDCSIQWFLYHPWYFIHTASRWTYMAIKARKITRELIPKKWSVRFLILSTSPLGLLLFVLIPLKTVIKKFLYH
jgi:glycosyltransferase involved in cell wall biosynthesis